MSQLEPPPPDPDPPSPPGPTLTTSPDRADRKRLAFLCLTAMGVVYGDIGTSPLYAIRECFFGPHAVPVTPQNVLGVLSLIFWTIVIVVSIKYVLYVLRADNDGEGGVLALMALAIRQRKRRPWLLIALGLFGAALLYGDGMITPAISVLSAVEGLEVATPFFRPYVVPLTIVILIGLFLVQRRGTAAVGVVFGPIVLGWFLILALLGVASIIQRPAVIAAVNPIYAWEFFLINGSAGYLVLGAVFLVATGAEALYADLGHFGQTPIRFDWFSIVAPALVLNYFGQGALLLRNPAAAQNPFYRLAPEWALYPLVILATAATVIASQAVISGVFSLTRQALQLGYAPRMEIVHTSSREIGQIYIPSANWALMIATIALVVKFDTSSNLAAAYGVAVTTTMIITTLLAFTVARRLWRWSLPALLAITIIFLGIDFAFFGANIIKIAQGGWVPLVIAAVVFAGFTTWRRGRAVLAGQMAKSSLPAETVIDDIVRRGILRVPGTAVFLTGSSEGTPSALLHNIKHNRAVHEQNVFLTVVTEDVPHAPDEGRTVVEDLGHGFHRVIVRYGFMEDPDIPQALRSATTLSLDPYTVTYMMSRNTVISTSRNFLGRLRDWLFIVMMQNALVPTQFFRLPPNRVVELGKVVELSLGRTSARA